MTEEKPNPFTLIKHAGEPNRAEFEGVTVTRQDKIFADDWGLVPCTPYDDHFIFEVPQSRQRIGMWCHMCTCGSHAVIAKPENEKQKMFVCFFYHSRLVEDGHGYHQTSVINKDDFGDIAGQTTELPKGKKWLI